MWRFLAAVPWRILFSSTIAGLLLALAYPRPDFAAIAWVALVPLCLCLHARPFWSGFAAGLGFFGLVLYWLNIVMVTFGHLHPLLSLFCYLVLVAYLALFFAGVTWVTAYLQRRLNLSAALTFPVLWVAFEYLRAHALTGFPWALLGYSQQSWLQAIQSADLFGVYGLSYLLALVNVTVALVIIALRERRPMPRLAIAASILLFSANLLYGYLSLQKNPAEREQTLTTTLVQGNIDQSIKWNPAFVQSTVDRYRDLSLAAAGEYKSELIVWPESATPFYYQDQNSLGEEVRQVAIRSQAALLFGSPAYEKRADGRWHFLNSAFLLGPQGETLGRGDKVHLVPFGEYVPLKKVLPFVNKLVEGIGDFSAGIIQPLRLGEHRIGILVCYEGIFPELARAYVNQGSDLLVNVTNDAWYGHSSAPYQHLSMARFRAIENRIWLARAANTGISAFIDPTGLIIGATPIFVTLSTTAKVGLGSRPTLYRSIGDALPLSFLLLCAYWFWCAWRRPQSS
ncbi:MAG: apolipoprotein N-acyltransferase [Desulfuromonadales bacterium]|nr:apolipoprotein N-acyltransferase [Desulfuromonadales bacterium]